MRSAHQAGSDARTSRQIPAATPATELRRAAGEACIDVHTDPDHHRSVFTLADASLTMVAAAARTLTLAAFETLDLRAHDGVHPRFGIVDVVVEGVLVAHTLID